MDRKEVEIVVYGADVLCPSCVNLPSSKETYEWLEAAIGRKYTGQPFKITYVDINNPPEDDAKKEFAEASSKKICFTPLSCSKAKSSAKAIQN